MSEPIREEGFYWVRREGEWLVAEYSKAEWYIPGCGTGQYEDEIGEIGTASVATARARTRDH